MGITKKDLLALQYANDENPLQQEDVAQLEETTIDEVSEAEYKEIFEVVDFAIEVQKAYGVVTEDNEVTLRDAIVIPDIVTKGKKALTGIKSIQPKNIVAVLPRLVVDLAYKFDLADDVLEQLIIESVTVLIQNINVGRRWTAYFRNKNQA